MPPQRLTHVWVYYEDVYNARPHNVSHVCVYYGDVYNTRTHNVSFTCVYYEDVYNRCPPQLLSQVCVLWGRL